VEDIMDRPADEDSVRQIEDRFNRAWNNHHPADMAESLADDAQFVTVNGARLNGRAAFQDLVERLHKGPFKDSQRETLELQIRFLAPDIAIAFSRFRISGDVDDDGRVIAPREGISTRVVRSQKGRWQTIAVHNTDIRNRRH
jgi:uncharacterized protein (TIGR02246 family)